MDNNEVYKFIEDNKFKYLNFLESVYDFPFVCYDSSKILHFYLKNKFNCDVKLVHGIFDGYNHYWIEAKNNNKTIIIDFVKFQFDNDLVGLSIEEIISRLDENYPYVDEDTYDFRLYEQTPNNFIDYYQHYEKNEINLKYHENFETFLSSSENFLKKTYRHKDCYDDYL